MIFFIVFFINNYELWREWAEKVEDLYISCSFDIDINGKSLFPLDYKKIDEYNKNINKNGCGFNFNTLKGVKYFISKIGIKIWNWESSLNSLNGSFYHVSSSFMYF